MEEKKFDVEHSNKVIEKMNAEIKKIEEKLLEGKTLEEQEEIKKEWEQNKIETEQKLKKEFEKFEKEREVLEKRESELIPIEDIKQGLNDMLKELDDNWNETLHSAIEDLCRDKTSEEKEIILNTFNNINNSNIVNALNEKMKKASFILDYNNSSLKHFTRIVVVDDYIYSNINNRINEYTDKLKADKIMRVSLNSAKKIKKMEKGNKLIAPTHNDVVDFINITTKERIYNLAGKVSDDIKKEYNSLVDNILKILEIK